MSGKIRIKKDHDEYGKLCERYMELLNRKIRMGLQMDYDFDNYDEFIKWFKMDKF